MTSRRGGLGKGLSSLIPAELQAEGAVYREIDVNSIVTNPNQPRRQFDEESLAALSASVAEVGVIQPVIVRVGERGCYELIAGERRWRAAKRVGVSTIPALVRATDARGSLVTAIVENLHRQDLNPLEEAAAYRQLIDDFELTQQEVARRVGRSRSAVANTIRLLQLPAVVQRLLLDNRLSAGHARALLAVQGRSAQETLAGRVVDEGLTVRQVEDLLKPAPGSDSDNSNGHSSGTGHGGHADHSGKGRPGRSEPLPEPGVLELEELLATRLHTRVKIRMGKGLGRIVVDFADLDDLERIYRIMTPMARRSELP